MVHKWYIGGTLVVRRWGRRWAADGTYVARRWNVGGALALRRWNVVGS